MLIYHVQLVNAKTKEVVFEAMSESPVIPSQKELDHYPGCLLIIKTREGLPENFQQIDLKVS